MRFEWDAAKNASNIAKRGVTFEIAKAIFDGPVLTFADNRRDTGEPRSNTIGKAGSVAILLVTHTDRQGVTRIISARPANRTERKRFDAEI